MFVWTEESAAFWADSGDYTHSYDRLAEMASTHLAPGGTLFEGGCGLGHLSVALAQQGFDVTAMDLSPLPLNYLREHAARAGVRLTVREGDAFTLPAGEVYDNAIFCFFGSVTEALPWARGHCRDKLILFKKNWKTHRFTREAGVLRKFTYPLTLAELEQLGVPFETEVRDVDMGQPFRSLEDGVRFFRLYDGSDDMTEADIRPRLVETGDPAFPWYLPAVRSVGMIVIRAGDIPGL